MGVRIAREDRGRFVANALSVSRIPLAALLWVMPGSPAWVLSLMVLAGLTDVLDGWVIRRWHARRWAERDAGAFAASLARGAFIDGLADKIFVASTVAVLVVAVSPPWWTIPVLLARELFLSPFMVAFRFASRERQASVDFTSGPIGKAATIAQFAALVLGFLDPVIGPALGQPRLFPTAVVVAGTLGVAAALGYVFRCLVPTNAAESA